MDVMILILAAASGLAIYRSVPALRRHIDDLAGEQLLPDGKEEKKGTTNKTTRK